jgi:PAS domain S-box-containing protein
LTADGETDSTGQGNAHGAVKVLPDNRVARATWRWNSSWTAGVLLFLSYAATAAATIGLVEHAEESSLLAMSIATPWLAIGVGVIGLLLGGLRLWPALFFGSWVVWGGLVGDPPLSVTIDAAVEAGSIVLIAHLLSVWGFHRSFDRLRDPLILLAAATVGRGLDTALDLTNGFVLGWLAPDSVAPFYRRIMTDAGGIFPALTPALVSNALHWTVNCTAGIMLVVPLVSARREDLQKWYRHQRMSLVALLLALLGWSAAALTLPMAGAQPLLITALMLVAWAAVRFGPPAAAFATLTMSVVVTVGIAMQLGLLASSTVDDIGLEWGFIALLALTGLSLTALLAERRHDLEQLRIVAEHYRRLFKSNPSPLWVAEPNGGRILMVNDQALRHYGFSEAEFLDMTALDLSVGPRTDAVSASADSARGGGSHTLRHRTRGGTIIDVHLLATSIELDGRSAELCYAMDVTDRFEMRSRILASVDLERGRLAQELHDGLGQILTGLSLGARAAITRASRAVDIDPTFIDFLLDSTNEAVKLCRQLTRGVSPLHDANGDLLEALRHLPHTVSPGSGPQLEVDVESRAPLRLSLERSEHLYRLVQEAVTNALKHAHAAHIRVRVVVTSETVQVGIEDDGVGIGDFARAADGFGLRSMRLRAAAVGASVDVLARPGGGTLICCECLQREPSEGTHLEPVSEGNPTQAPGPPRVESNTPSLESRPRAITYLGQCFLLATACLVGFSVTVLLATIIDPRLDIYSARLAVPSLLMGFSVAGVMLGGRRLWPGIAVGTWVGAVALLQETWLYGLYYGAAVALAALIIIELLSRWRFSRAFDHWQDPLLLLGAALVGGGVIQLLDFVGILIYQWLRPGELTPAVIALITDAGGATPVVSGAFLSALARWWADSVAGVVLFVPLLVATPPMLRTLRGKGAEAAGWCLALLAWLGCMFVLREAGARLPLVAMALVLLVWAVVRFGVAMASIAISVCAMAATLSFVMQRGVLTTIGVNEGIDTLWDFLALLTVTGMFLTVLLAERNRTLHELDAAAQRHRRLFADGPHPMWVQDRATGRILMVNEQAIAHYGYSEDEWLALTVEELTVNLASAVMGVPGRECGLIETRHRVKDGTLIDVELSHALIDMSGRPTLLCFAVDVTERNALRREFLEAIDLERRRLANELRFGFDRTLAELESAAARLQLASGSGRVDSAAIELIARSSQRAVELCRQIAHRATTAGNRFAVGTGTALDLS